jgi:hypothetical protein
MPDLKPSFFIVGAPKAGTTALHDYLAGHPEVCMSSDKEPNYFSDKEIQSQGLYYEKKNPKNEQEYLALFSCKESHKIAGESSVSYLFYPEVAQRIFDFNPAARIIISLREPVSRAFSHYLMDYSLGLVSDSFEDIVFRKKSGKAMPIYYQQYVELGFYYQQVKRYLDLFPSGQVLIFLHDELSSEPSATLEKLSGFLGIRHFRTNEGLKQSNVSGAPGSVILRSLYQNRIIRKSLATLFSHEFKTAAKSLLFSKKNLPALNEKTRTQLSNLYVNDIKDLELLLGRNLTHWLK